MKVDIENKIRINRKKIRECEKEIKDYNFMIKLYRANIEVLQLECKHQFKVEGVWECKVCDYIGGVK